MEFESENDVEVDEDPELHDAAEDYEWTREALDKAKNDFAEAKTKLLKVLDARGEKSAHVDLSGVAHKITAVSVERAKVVDEPGLLAKLTTEQIEEITVRKVDTALLTQAVTRGTVDPALVAEHVAITETAGYLRVTRMEGTANQ